MPYEHTVISCGRQHVEGIRSIYNDAIVHTTALYEYAPRSAETMQAWMASKESARLPVLGIECEPGVLAGFATWGPFRSFPAYKYSVEHSVYVGLAYRRCGVGRALLNALVLAAQTHDLHMLIGGIDATNAGSIALHRQLGFSHCATIQQAGFKFGRWLDLEFWQRILPTPAQPVAG